MVDELQLIFHRLSYPNHLLQSHNLDKAIYLTKVYSLFRVHLSVYKSIRFRSLVLQEFFHKSVEIDRLCQRASFYPVRDFEPFRLASPAGCCAARDQVASRTGSGLLALGGVLAEPWRPGST